MTKTAAKGKMANRRKKAKEETQDLPQQPSPKPVDDPLEPTDEGDERDKPLDQPAEHSEPYGSSEEEEMEDSIIKQKSMELTPEQEQELAEFYEENPCFYDKSRSDFKNSKKKDRLL
ncbi:uncharacterized protein LOC128171449 [Crassostrea angulata]|uniref:uncharacterized protein LOC128171449 n=1 Tax=Magallana angulata TaxID=2784310 RepID=UPI0022B0E3C4|nr:uncharacterized protein LOC128171449 [Crassostrea angulata]